MEKHATQKVSITKKPNTGTGSADGGAPSGTVQKGGAGTVLRTNDAALKNMRKITNPCVTIAR
jgi:hypothetical protein